MISSESVMVLEVLLDLKLATCRWHLSSSSFVITEVVAFNNTAFVIQTFKVFSIF